MNVGKSKKVKKGFLLRWNLQEFTHPRERGSREGQRYSHHQVDFIVDK